MRQTQLRVFDQHNFGLPAHAGTNRLHPVHDISHGDYRGVDKDRRLATRSMTGARLALPESSWRFSWLSVTSLLYLLSYTVVERPG